MKTKENKPRLKKSAPSLIRKMFRFVMGKNLDDFISLATCRRLGYEFALKIKNLNEKNFKEHEDILKNFSFFKNENYEQSSIPDLDTMSNLENFRDELVIVIEIKFNKKRKPCKLVRQISPPLSAYKYKGFSPEVKPTGRDYGLLFE